MTKKQTKEGRAVLVTTARRAIKESLVRARQRAVLVTTVHRGVFFGYATVTNGETIKLARARLCLYWSRDVKGFMGLASEGPSNDCRIGPAADIELRAVTSVVEVTKEAAAKWEAAPWSS